VSTKAAEDYGDDRERVVCKICCGLFVAHKYYEYKFFKMPDDVCIWCYSRGFGSKSGLYWRWETMERALRAISNVACLKDEPSEDCKCLTCYAKRTMEKVDGSRPQRPNGRADKIAEVATPIAESPGMEGRTTAEGPSGHSSTPVQAGI